MYKSYLFFIGMVLFFTAIPSLADESRYDEPSYLLWRRLLENDIDDKNPKPRDKQERSLDEDVEEKSPFAGEKTPDDKLERGLEEDVEEKSPFAGEKTPDEKEEKKLLESDLVDKRKKPKRLLSAGNPNRKRILATDDVEEKSPFAGEKTPDDKEENQKKLLENDPLPPQYKRGRLLSVDVEGRSLYNPNRKRILADDVEEKSPFAGEKTPDEKEENQKKLLENDPLPPQYKRGRLLSTDVEGRSLYNPNRKRILVDDVEEKSPFAGEKTPDEKEEKKLLENDPLPPQYKRGRLLSADVEGRSLYNPNRKRILADDVEEKSMFAGEKTPDEKEEKKILENDPLPPQYKRGRLLSADVEGRSLEVHNPNLKRILATDGEVENPLYVEKIGRLLEEESKTRKLNVDASPNDEGEKLGRLLADELKKSPFYDGKTSNDDIENPKGPAKAPGMSPSSKLHRKGRTYGSFYVEKPREHQPLIMNPQKSPNRRLLGDSLGQ